MNFYQINMEKSNNQTQAPLGVYTVYVSGVYSRLLEYFAYICCRSMTYKQ